VSDTPGPAYLLIETQSDTTLLRDATVLAAAGHQVWLYLAQEGVLAVLSTRGDTRDLDRAAGAGVQVWVDRFSVHQRALPVDRLLPAARVVDPAQVAETLLDPAVRAVWH
jgi:hypothetical protein